MFVYVSNYVKGCAICQQMKVNTHPTRPALSPIDKPNRNEPFATTSCDFITDLPPSLGFDSIMVMVDHGLTKGVVLEPCNKTIDAEGTAEIFRRTVFRRFGLPDTIISDRGPQFASRVFQETCKLLEIKSKMSTAYHPQTDGETERVNQELETYLRIFCQNAPNDWAKLLPEAEFAHNQRAHSARPESPFYLMMGYHPKTIETKAVTMIPSVENRLSRLNFIRKEAAAMHVVAQQRMAERQRSGWKPFQIGEKVWLEGRNLNIPYVSRKLAPKREGPFIIIGKRGSLAYQLELPPQWRVHDVFHVSLLSRFHETKVHGPSYARPPPENIAGEAEHEVEAIVGHRGSKSRRQYLVKWAGYPTAENEYLTEAELANSEKLLQAYKQARKLE